MAQERLILDPAEMTEGTRTEFDITPWLDIAGIDWGDAEIQAYRAQAQVGESVIAYRLPNRNIVAPLVIRDQGGTTFATARSYIQAKAAMGQREGLIGKRILATGGTVYFDVVADGLSLAGDWMQANRGVDTEAELRLEAIPDFYEPEVEVASAEEKTAAELIKVIPDPGGDMPARVRIVVEEKQGVNQLGLVWAFRSRHYSAATTAKTPYEAEELLVLDAARKVALSGASGGTVVQHGTISTNWTPIVGGRIGGTAFPTHTGTNRIFARVYSTSGTSVQARLVWDVGDLVNAAENPAYRVPGKSNFYIADLGEVRLDKAPVGSHRWDWQIQAKGNSGSEDFKVDKVWVVNADEGMGRLTALPSPTLGIFTLGARDPFNQTAGTLNGKALPDGSGNWATSGSAKGDFEVVAGTKHYLTRTASGDSEERYATAPGGEFGLIVIQIEFEWSVIKELLLSGISEKAVGAPALRAEMPSGEPAMLNLHGNRVEFDWQAAARYKLTLLFNGAAGYSLGYVNDKLIVTTSLNVPATIPIKLSDFCGGAGVTRVYDNFAAWVPVPNAVSFASKSVQLTTDGMYRLDSGGSAYGPVSRVVGDLPRLPAGGLEGRSTELFLKSSRGDLAELPDSALDDLGAKVLTARSWLTVPGTI